MLGQAAMSSARLFDVLLLPNSIRLPDAGLVSTSMKDTSDFSIVDHNSDIFILGQPVIPPRMVAGHILLRFVEH